MRATTKEDFEKVRKRKSMLGKRFFKKKITYVFTEQPRGSEFPDVKFKVTLPGLALPSTAFE